MTARVDGGSSDALTLSPRKKSWGNGIPPWAIALAFALVATCIAVLALGKLFMDEASRHQADYDNCLAGQRSAKIFILATTRLRDADQAILDAVTAGKRPVTAFGRVDLVGITDRVVAYNEILSEAENSVQFDCASLR